MSTERFDTSQESHLSKQTVSLQVQMLHFESTLVAQIDTQPSLSIFQGLSTIHQLFQHDCQNTRALTSNPSVVGGAATRDSHAFYY